MRRDLFQLRPALGEDLAGQARLQDLIRENADLLSEEVYGLRGRTFVRAAQPPEERPAQPPQQPEQPQPRVDRPAPDKVLGDKVPEKVEKVSPVDDKGNSPLDQAQQLMSKVRNADDLKLHRATFEKLVKDADVGISPKLLSLQRMEEKAKADLTTAFTPANATRLRDHDNNAEVYMLGLVQNGKLTETQLQNIAQLWAKLERACSDAERKKIKDAIVAQCTDEDGKKGLKKYLDDRDAIIGAKVLGLVYDCNRLRERVTDEENHQALVRWAFARALKAGGENDEAQKMFLQAAAKNKDNGMVAFMRQAAGGFGLKPDQIPDVGRAVDVPPPQPQPKPSDRSACLLLLMEIKPKFDAMTDKQEGLKQYGPKFQEAIKLADTEAENIEKKLRPEIKKLEKRLKELQDAVPDEDKKLFNQANNPDATPEQRAQAAKVFSEKQKELVKVATELNAQNEQVQRAVETQFIARFAYANAFEQAGKVADASKFLKEAFSKLPANLQQETLQDPNVTGFMQRLGLRPEDVGIKVEAPPEAPKAPALVGADGKPLEGLAAKYNSDTLIRLAQSNARKGLKAAQEYFEAAIKRAEAEVKPDDIKKRVTALLSELESGKKDLGDGKSRPLTPVERIANHGQIAALLGLMRAPFEARVNYATMLKSAGQYDAAEKEYNAAKKAADAFPIDLINRAVVALGKDSDPRNANMPEVVTLPGGKTLTKGDLQAEALSLNEQKQLPIKIRQTMIRYFIGGGVDSRGNDINDSMILGYDDNGLPKNGEKKTPVLKQKEAADLVNETVDKQKSINDNDVIADPRLDPQLAALTQLVLDNSSEELKKNLRKTSQYWDKTVSAITAGAVGLAIAAGLLLITRRPQAAELGLGLWAGASNAGKLAAVGAGFIAAAGTDYGMMRGVFGHEDFTVFDATVQGGGSFLAAGALLGARGLVGGMKGAGYTSGRFGELSVNALKAAGETNPTVFKAAGMVTAEGQPTINALAKAFELEKLVPPAAVRAAITAGRGAEALTPALASELAASGSGYYNMLMLSRLFPWARGVQFTADATLAASHGNRVSRLLNAINPYGAVDASAIATASAVRNSKLITGFTAMMAYNTVDSLSAGTADWVRGLKGPDGKPVMPWDAFTGKLVAMDLSNIVLQSALMAPFVGNLNLGRVPYVTPWGAAAESQGLARLYRPVTSQPGYLWSATTNFLNPGVINAPGGLITSGLFNPGSVLNQGGQLLRGYMEAKQGDNFKEALERLNKPLTDDPDHPLKGK